MANEIRIQTSVQIVQDNDVTVEGIGYTHDILDGNADSRSWGGSYIMNQAYADGAVGYWKNVVLEDTTANGLDNSDCFEGEPAVTDGTIPGTAAYVVAVEFVSMLGTDTTVNVTVSGEILAVLDPGQSIVIPLEMSEAIADVKLHAGHFTNGSREATVNVMVAGTA